MDFYYNTYNYYITYNTYMMNTVSPPNRIKKALTITVSAFNKYILEELLLIKIISKGLHFVVVV